MAKATADSKPGLQHGDLAGVAPLFKPPYVAVIFTSIRTDGDNGYGDMAERMLQLAAGHDGYLGVESCRDASSGVGITCSYWRTAEHAIAWKRQTEHLEAQKQGRAAWYSQYRVRVAVVEREYGWH